MGTYYIACGGTGGHLYPGLAVAERLHQDGHQVRLFVSPKRIDQDILTAHPEFKYTIVELTGWPGLRPTLFRFGWQFLKALQASRKLLKAESPQAVLGMGGFSCAPLLLASSWAGIPSYLHESNVIPGKATRLLCRFVKNVFIGFKSCRDHLKGADTVWTGTPVRNSLVNAETGGLRVAWEISESAVVIAVTGGSQGAQGLNRLVCQALPHLEAYRESLHFIHLTGQGEDEVCRREYKKNGFKAHVMPFSHEIEKIFGAADLVVARSGAATLTECAWFGLPAILVPYPYAAENHQKFNALEYVNYGGGLMVEESAENAEENFLQALEQLIASETSRAEMKQCIIQARVSDAVGQVIRGMGVGNGGASHE
jgi:UDP-N-acetylglucosamine--N-acetylmuramyl-(pentapeptide) pyrophosphoryl-undecaprenol N-acetylglucosamine transferase